MKNKKSIGIIVGVLCLICAVGLGIYFFFPRVDFAYIVEAASFAECDDSTFTKVLKVGDADVVHCGYEGVNVKKGDITWSSSDPSVAMVDDSGKITAVDVGETKVVCKVRDKETSLVVQVQGESNTSNAQFGDYQFDADNKAYLFLDVGEKKNLEIYYEDSKKKVTSNVKFSSSSSKIATVDSAGVVTAKGVGKGKITAKVNNITMSIPVIVRKSNSSNIYFLDIQNTSQDKLQYGDAFILETKKGNFGLIDTGYDGSNMCSRIRSYLTSLGVEKLDFVLISHMHDDHYGCYESLFSGENRIPVDNLYIKKYSPDVNDLLKARYDIAQKIVDSATNNGIKVNYITQDSNENFYLDEMEFWVTNRKDIFSSKKRNEKCEILVKSGAKKGETICSENTNSLAVLLSIKGTNRTSRIYFANDIENNGAANNEVTFSGVGKVSRLFGNGLHRNKGGKKKNLELYREDVVACYVRDYIIGYENIDMTDDEMIDTCQKTADENREKLKKGKFSNKDAVDIDVYQVSHHGVNNSLTVYSYLKPKYVVFSSGYILKDGIIKAKTRNYKGKYKFMREIVGIDFGNKESLTGLGTLIYSVDSDGNISDAIKMSNDDK